MDLDESQLITALQEAFTYYLRFLSHTQRLRESKLPRQGKGVETKADVSTHNYYESRVVATETCLQYTGKIAQRVIRWSNDLSDPFKDETLHVEEDNEKFNHFLDDEEPYLDNFTGTWIHPTTPFSAGTSGSHDEAANEKVENPKSLQTECLRNSTPPVEKEVKIPEVKQIRPIFRPLTQPSLGIHPNTSISLSCLSIDQDSQTKQSAPRSATLTLNSTTSSEDESNEDEDSSGDSSDRSEVKRKPDRRQTRREESSDSERTETSDDSEESEGDREYDRGSVTSEMASAFYLQKNSKDMMQARKLHAEERRRKEENASRLQAQRMQDEEKSRLRAREALIKKLERQERERAEQIRKDREVAQRAQDRWEAAAIARETEAMRAEERRRRENTEKKRLVEEQKRLRIEKEQRSAERLRERNRVLKEEERRRDERLQSDARRKHRDHERRRSPVRRASPPRKAEILKKARFSDKSDIPRRVPPPSPRKPVPLRTAEITKKSEPPKKAAAPKNAEPSKRVDCVSCMEPGVKKDMAVLPCKHVYCGDCIKEAFKSAYNSHTLFKCCGATIPSKSIPHLSTSFIAKYSLLTAELSTKNPKYCSLPGCSAFLPPNSIHGSLGVCSSCKTRTCLPCGKAEHQGICKEDREGKKLEDLAKKQGWKQCPNCSQILERTYGCLHMTCRCGSEWCYSCLRDWKICGSACSRGEPNGGWAMPDADEMPFPNLPHLNNAPFMRNFRPGPPPPRNFPNVNDPFDDVRMDHDRANGARRMAGAGTGVIPVIATAVLMALFS